MTRSFAYQVAHTGMGGRDFLLFGCRRSREANVKRPLVCVKPCILHWQHPCRRVCFVVVRVPPARRGRENTPCAPVEADRVLDPPIFAQLWAHVGVDPIWRRRHAQVEGHRIVPVGPLGFVGRQHVEQGPQRVREGLGVVLGDGIAEENAHAIAVLGSWFMADALHFGQHSRVGEVRCIEFLHAGFDTQVLHQGLVGDPVYGSVVSGGVHYPSLGGRDDEQVTRCPRNTVAASSNGPCAGPRATNDVESLRCGRSL